MNFDDWKFKIEEWENKEDPSPKQTEELKPDSIVIMLGNILNDMNKGETRTIEVERTE